MEFCQSEKVGTLKIKFELLLDHFKFKIGNQLSNSQL